MFLDLSHTIGHYAHFPPIDGPRPPTGGLAGEGAKTYDVSLVLRLTRIAAALESIARSLAALDEPAPTGQLGDVVTNVRPSQTPFADAWQRLQRDAVLPPDRHYLAGYPVGVSEVGSANIARRG